MVIEFTLICCSLFCMFCLAISTLFLDFLYFHRSSSINSLNEEVKDDARD